MTDRIYVTYTPTTAPESYHTTIHYERTDSAGNVVKHVVIEAQPEKLKELSASDKAIGVVEETFRNGDGPSRFGRIDAKVRDHKTSDPDAPFEIIAEGDDLSANLARMQLFAHGVNRAGFAYRGDHQNSNSFASATLQAGELPPATGVAHDPAGPPGELLDFFAPGLNEPLRAPIGLDSRPVVLPGDTSSPVLRAPRLERRSAAPDGAAWTSAQAAAPATPAFRRDAAYSPAGDFYRTFPHASAIAAAPSPTAFSASGPSLGSQITDALNAAGNRAVPVLTRVGKLVGDSLIAPAEGAPSALLLRDPTAPNLPGDDTQGIDSSKPERRLSRRIVNPSAGVSGDRPSSPAPQESQGPLSLNDAYLLYLARLNANKPQASMSDSTAPTAPFDATNRNPPRLSAADWIASLAGVDLQNPTQFARSPQTRGLAGSSYSSNPVQPWLDAPIGGAPDNSAASGNDNRHWYVPLGGLLWDGNKSPAPPAADPGVPASPIVSTDDPNYSGGLLGRYLALAGLDPQNSNQPAPPPLDDEQDQANLQALKAELSSTGNIRDAVALYKARKASRARGTLSQA